MLLDLGSESVAELEVHDRRTGIFCLPVVQKKEDLIFKRSQQIVACLSSYTRPEEGQEEKS